MSKGNKLLRGALLLTAVNLSLRTVSTSFQVYLSRQIGAAGVGLLQLILSVNMLALTAGMAGGRTAAMYLTASELGRGKPGNADRLLSGCFVYAIVTAGTAAAVQFLGSPWIAEKWVGTADALPALRTWAAFLPVLCLGGVMSGYFTAADRIGTLAAVEVGEQLFTMLVTVAALRRVPVEDRAGACGAVVLGSCLGGVMTLACLLILYSRCAGGEDSRIPVARRIVSTAAPLAVADDLKAGISSVEHLIVPRRLALYPGAGDPLAAFGAVSGMVFPVMMFPAAILSSLSEVLLPELARCTAVGSKRRIRYLIRRNLRITMLYGLGCAGLLFLLAEPICGWLYPGETVAPMLRRFSLLVPMLYLDLICDGMNRGLGEQKAVAAFSILSNVVDVGLLFVLLPRFGIDGYCFSFALTHILNFALGLRKLLRIGDLRLPVRFPICAAAAAIPAVLGAGCFTGVLRQSAAFGGLFFSLCWLLGVLTPGDIRWLRKLIKPPKKLPEIRDATNS